MSNVRRHVHLPLRDALVPRIRSAFPQARVRIGGDDESMVVFPAAHPEVGDLTIQDEGDEITVLLGDITHLHFASQDPRLDAQTRADLRAAEVVEYLQKLFADKIEFYGTGRGGGARERSTKKRGVLSRYFLGKKAFVWSGPVEQGDA